MSDPWSWPPVAAAAAAAAAATTKRAAAATTCSCPAQGPVLGMALAIGGIGPATLPEDVTGHIPLPPPPLRVSRLEGAAELAAVDRSPDEDCGTAEDVLLGGPRPSTAAASEDPHGDAGVSGAPDRVEDAGGSSTPDRLEDIRTEGGA